MALSQRLDLRQTQSLVMTPQLQQAIKLLQLSNLELAAYIEREIEQNPLLERDDGEGGEGGDGAGGDGAGGDGAGERAGTADGSGEPAGDEAGPEPAETAPRDSLDMANAETYGNDSDQPLDTDYENVWTNGSLSDGDGQFAQTGRGGSADFDDDGPGLEQTLTGETSLRDHLIGQLNVDVDDPADRLIGLALIDLLDEAGYLTQPLEPVAEQFGCPVARVEAVLARLQRFDPPGVFARSLAECLAIQLIERNRYDPAMQALVENLTLLAERNVPALLTLCGIDAADLADMIAEIRALNPKPAMAFDRSTAPLVVPDILMRGQPGGGWIIELNPDTLPRVLVNRRYLARVGGNLSKTDRDYLNERLNSANWLVKSLHQRAGTILKVATELVRQQDGFLRYGVQYLKPLILRDIADAIGMHESTVSRVTSNKFIATPRGLFELKYFFTAAIAGADGHAAHSAEAVRARLRQMIDQEAADAILSDDQLVDALRREGIDIARRTVAKYREGMRIPSSVQRRREKKLGLA